MGDNASETHPDIEARIVGLYNVVYDDGITRADIDFYEVEDAHTEGEVYLPEFGLNVDLWRKWSTEKRIEVLLHEFAHTENYADDHHPSFWERVVSLTETTIERKQAVEDAFDAEIDERELKRTVVDSVHEYVVEQDVDSVAARRREVHEALGLPDASSAHE